MDTLLQERITEYPVIFDAHSVIGILNTNADHSAIDSNKPIKYHSRRVVKCRKKGLPLPQTMEPWLLNIQQETDDKGSLIGIGEQETDDQGRPAWIGTHPDYPTGAKWFTCQYGKPGDLLWIKETWSKVPRTAYSQSTGVWQTFNPENNHDAAVYKAGWERVEPTWKSPIFMPRWGSRITLKLSDVWVERLQDISYIDMLAEGLAVYEGTQLLKPELPLDKAVYKDQWIRRWDSINKKRGYPWDLNPWVWVLEFHQVIVK